MKKKLFIKKTYLVITVFLTTTLAVQAEIAAATNLGIASQINNVALQTDVTEKIKGLYAIMQQAEGKSIDAETQKIFATALVNVYNDAQNTLGYLSQLLAAAATTPLLNGAQQDYVEENMTIAPIKKLPTVSAPTTIPTGLPLQGSVAAVQAEQATSTNTGVVPLQMQQTQPIQPIAQPIASSQPTVQQPTLMYKTQGQQGIIPQQTYLPQQTSQVATAPQATNLPQAGYARYIPQQGPSGYIPQGIIVHQQVPQTTYNVGYTTPTGQLPITPTAQSVQPQGASSEGAMPIINEQSTKKSQKKTTKKKAKKKKKKKKKKLKDLKKQVAQKKANENKATKKIAKKKKKHKKHHKKAQVPGQELPQETQINEPALDLTTTETATDIPLE